jgi:hypothetical protein
MAKLKLDIDALRVETFTTATPASERGTVRARSDEEPAPGDAVFLPITDWKTCQGGDCTARTLCYYSCQGVCYAEEVPVVAAGWV